MKLRSVVTIILGVVLLAACSPVALTTSFNPNDATYINTKGKASISGQAFLRRNDGLVVYAAGSEVALVPTTVYARERIAAIYGTAKYATYHPGFKNTDPEYLRYSRKAVANGEGRFNFDGVADGSYFVTTEVLWFVGGSQQGGVMLERVTITGGQSIEIIMTGQ